VVKENKKKREVGDRLECTGPHTEEGECFGTEMILNYFKNEDYRRVLVAHACNPSYSGCRDQ
jgi:hypothetical protein